MEDSGSWEAVLFLLLMPFAIFPQAGEVIASLIVSRERRREAWEKIKQGIQVVFILILIVFIIVIFGNG